MALTRNFLKALGLNEEQIGSIVEAHTETISGIKNELKEAQTRLSELENVEKELNDLKAANKEAEDYKAKYDTEHSAFEQFKSEIADRDTKAAKEAAVKAFFEGNGIKGNNLKIAMRGARDEINAIELDGNKIKDESSLNSLINGEFSGLVGTTFSQGVDVATPPSNTGGRMTRDQIFAIEDDTERQTAIANNLDLFE